MRWFGALALGLVALGGLAAEPVIKEARVTSEPRPGKAWSTLVGRVEATTDLSVDQLKAVIADWAAYPRLFPQIRLVSTKLDGEAVLVSETVVVSILGFEVTKRFTLRMRTTLGPEAGRWSLSWTTEATDGTIDKMEGGWDLVPTLVDGRLGTRIDYRTVSSVPQSIPGQDSLVGLFYPGELKQIVSAVLIEARKRKEKP